VPGASLPKGYAIKHLSHEEFMPLFQERRAAAFDQSIFFRYREAMSAPELAAFEERSGRYKGRFSVNLALYHHDNMVGWCWGVEENPEKFYMVNSYVEPDNRRQGFYTKMMEMVLLSAQAAKFQIIYSRHAATNNPVLIPKLKAGFIVSGFEISDAYGLLLHLSYYTNPLRRRAMDYRVGERRPDAELLKYFNSPSA
jgi:GNAT superfamily N-acetyltransferase